MQVQLGLRQRPQITTDHAIIVSSTSPQSNPGRSSADPVVSSERHAADECDRSDQARAALRRGRRRKRIASTRRHT